MPKEENQEVIEESQENLEEQLEENLEQQESQEEQEQEESQESQETEQPQKEEKSESDWKVAFEELRKEFKEAFGTLGETIKTSAAKTNQADEWTLEKIDIALDKIDKGELSEEHRPFLRQKEREILKNEIRNEIESTTKISEASQSFISEATQAWNQALSEHPELKDPESPLFKKARDLFLQDRGSKAFLVKDHKELDKMNLDLVDARMQYRYVKLAAAQLSQSKPKVNKREQAKSALSGNNSMAAASKSSLQKLEEKAAQTGDPRDWRNLFKEQARLSKLKRQ